MKREKKKLKSVATMHPCHCAGACLLNLHIEDGKVVRVTSAGDIAREGAEAEDESLAPVQRRACAMGYSEMNRVYGPDRIKYPMIQTKKRGDRDGFKRISWDEALDTIVEWYQEMLVRKEELGYLPVWDEDGITPFLGPCLKKFGNFSCGNTVAAVNGALGTYERTPSNPALDILNSKYIILWSCNLTETLRNLSFHMVKAKEAGIPITAIEVRGTETAFTFATGKGKVPGLITLRPGTDGVLMSAMANIIYRKELYNKTFVKEHCFGFYPGDTVISDSGKRDPVTGEVYRGQKFQVPEGKSFVEYLDSLEQEHGGYAGVMEWAAEITGIPEETIENFAIEYASSGPAYIFSDYHGGAQRMQNGMYHSWLLIALSAMTGYINQSGGGFGDVSLKDGYQVSLPPSERDVDPDPRNRILFSGFRDSDTILNGLDGRTKEELRDDVWRMNGIDLGEDAHLEVDMFVRGAGCNNIFNQTQNINKRVMAFDKLKYAVAYERFLAPTAAMCDIVLPVVTAFEESYFAETHYSDTYVVNGPIEPMYEAKPDWWINEQLAKRLGITDYPIQKLSDKALMKEQWKKASIPDSYKKINPDKKLPSFDEMIEKGNFQLEVPQDKPYIPLKDKQPGRYDTETGKINFYSPYYEKRNRSVLGEHRACYVKNPESYEDIKKHGGIKGEKGSVYKLQLYTPHVFSRAHTSFDNVPVIKEQLLHTAQIHPEDAAIRGLKNGDMTYVYNDIGCIKIPVEVTRRILPGTIAVPQGVWYRPSKEETYEVWFDTDYDGIPEKHTVPVDVGGCCNTIIPDRNAGVLDPFTKGLGMSSGGTYCEISLTKGGE